MSITELPKIAIVGRPNVGKSSIFNKMVGSRKAIVEASCGTTRDRLYADIVWNKKEFTIVDTGGFEESKEGDIAAMVLKQLNTAIREADVILFVTDLTAGILPQDEELASRLRKTSKKIYLVVNKVDDASKKNKAMEFYELGLGDPYMVSAVNSIGIEGLLNSIAGSIDNMAAPETKHPIGIAIVGRPNVGKSSYLNSILNEERVMVHHIAGTTRDAVDINFNYRGRDYLLIDTAGIRHNAKIKESADFFGSVRSKEALKRADVAAILIDGHDGLREDDMRIINFAMDEGKALAILVNKCDLFKEGAIHEYKERLVKKMNAVRNFPIAFISCKTKTNVIPTLDILHSIYEKSGKVVHPDDIKAALDILKADSNMKRNGIAVIYLKQDGTRPPRFVIGVKSGKPVNSSIKRYLENFLRNRWDFEGVSINIVFDNKYKPR